LWLERDDKAERVKHLVRLAAEVGFGQLRVFLMWPWVQDHPDQSDFSLFDHAFDAAANTGVKVKATLTANSGPWWLGTPSVLHSHTPLLRDDWIRLVTAYVEKCVRRYAGHPALGQWVIWNEPYYSLAPPRERAVRPERVRRAWAALLEETCGSVAKLNRR
jgi:beta-glucosidase/6-phospho-beta-glucosidase/beta-galactosidase